MGHWATWLAIACMLFDSAREVWEVSPGDTKHKERNHLSVLNKRHGFEDHEGPREADVAREVSDIRLE